ncbi:MAG TPA: hypothetical protein VIH34_00185 [Candidatus Bathyarchaeia archaeon]
MPQAVSALVKCSGCDRNIRPREPVSAVFTTDRHRSFFHRGCDGGIDQFARWKEEAPWAFKPTRLTPAEWKRCSPLKHLGVWQSIFIARRDEDVWCPDCGLKIARHESLTCPSCNGPAIVLTAEQTRMTFSHGELLHRLRVHCVGRGEESSAYAVISGFTPVAVTTKKREEPLQQASGRITLKYQPKGDPKQGFSV